MQRLGSKLDVVLKLQERGVKQSPVEFTIELVLIATCLQFVACGTLFYTTETVGHYDLGERRRAGSEGIARRQVAPFLRYLPLRCLTPWSDALLGLQVSPARFCCSLHL